MRVLDKIDARLVENEPKERRTPTGHWPSSASARFTEDEWREIRLAFKCVVTPDPSGDVLVGECLRAQWLKHTAQTPSNENDPGGILKMKMGGLSEELVFGLAQKETAVAREVAYKIEIDGLEFLVSGRMDGLEIDSDGSIVPWEMKSTYSYSATQVKKFGPKDTWILQHCWNIKGAAVLFPGHDMKRCKFVVLARDSLYRHEIDVVIDWDIVDLVCERCVNRWVHLEAALDSGLMPPPEYRHEGSKGDWTHWKCRYSATNKSKDGYCPYRSMCQEFEAKGIRLEARAEEMADAVGT